MSPGKKNVFGVAPSRSGNRCPETLGIPKISVRFFCTAQKLMPTSLAILRKSRLLSHISTFSSVVASLGRPDLSSSSMLSSTLKFCSSFFHSAIRRRLIPKCFHEVFVNFLGSHSLLTKIFYHRSHFNFLHFASLTHCPYKSNQA